MRKLRVLVLVHDYLVPPDDVTGQNTETAQWRTEYDVIKTHTAIGARILSGSTHLLLQMAEQIALTHHERWDGHGYIGGLREVPFEKMLKSHPERVIEWAVQGMLPKNRLGRAMAKKLKVYRGAEHPHEAQQPQALPATSRGGEGR